MAGQENSSTSSTDSCSYASLSSTSESPTKRDLSTDLRLGLSFRNSSEQEHSSSASTLDDSRDQEVSDWPPIKRLLRSALAERGSRRNPSTLFVKVYMEGIPIGRKLDLYSHDGYVGLISTLSQMFKSNIILCPELAQGSSGDTHVLTYEDKEGDWMVVGDVPWEFFLTTINRLKIIRADKC